MAFITLRSLYPKEKKLTIDTDITEARITISGERSLSACFLVPSGHRCPSPQKLDFLYNTLISLAEGKPADLHNYSNSRPHKDHDTFPKGQCSKEFNIGCGAFIKIGITSEPESVFLGIHRDGFISDITIPAPDTLSSLVDKESQDRMIFLYDTIKMMLAAG